MASQNLTPEQERGRRDVLKSQLQQLLELRGWISPAIRESEKDAFDRLMELALAVKMDMHY